MNFLNKCILSSISLILITIFLNSNIIAQRPADNFERRVHYFADDSVQYRLFIPSDSLGTNNYPLIYTAHGSGEIGNDNNSHIIYHRIAEAWAEDSVQNKYPSFICSPQFPEVPNQEDYLVNFWNPSINSLLDSLNNEFSIDTNRIYMTGLSFGAYGTWDFIYKSMPNRFAAVIPLSGGWPWEEIPIVTDVPFWAFCGEFDELVDDVRWTIDLVEAAGYDIEKRYTEYGNVFGDDPVDVGLTIDEIDLLNQNEKRHIYTEFTDGGHNVWSKTYDDPAVHYWLFSQKKNVNGRKINTQLLSSEVSPKYVAMQGDTIKIISEILNPESHTLDAYAYIEGVQSNFKDSILLYDDGSHGDMLPSDNISANYLPLQNLEEDFFDITVHATDLSEPSIIQSPEKVHFTTAGPVILDSFSVLISQDTIVGLMDMHLRNMSNTITMKNITARIGTADTNVISIPRAELSFSDISPNESKERDSGWMYFYTKNNPSQIKFLMEISSNNYPYWNDTLIVDIPTNVEYTKSTLPTTFALKQNYPNPFNPVTTIKYSIPGGVKIEKLAPTLAEAKVNSVVLKIFDILGREVATLVNEKQKPGNYEVSWDGTKQPSGVYFYRLSCGNYSSTKKMILLR